MLETLDHTIRIGSTPTFLDFDLYFYSAYAAHYVYITSYPISSKNKNKMAERFAEVNEQEIRELLDSTTPKIPCLSI